MSASELLVMVLKVPAVLLWLMNSWVPLTRAGRRVRGAPCSSTVWRKMGVCEEPHGVMRVKNVQGTGSGKART